MNEIKLRNFMPDKFIFKTEIPVRIGDINYGNHLGNAEFFYILHEARLQFLANINASEKDFFGCSLIMNKATVEFKSQVVYGDTLEIELAIINQKKVRFDIFYKINSKNNNKIACLATTSMSCIDYESESIKKIPLEFIEKIG
jgi:acyl-CoA thioester hydrolase